MKWIAKLLVIVTISIQAANAQQLPLTQQEAQTQQTPQVQQANQRSLRVGLTTYVPPFTMQASGGVYFGFDVAMMLDICKTLQVKCRFKPYPFYKLFDAVVNGEVDAAISSLSITLRRERFLDFTVPYMKSFARFLGKKEFAQKFSGLSQLNGKSIGVVRGTVFESTIELLNLKNVRLKTYKDMHRLMSALQDDQVQAVLLDNETTEYWAVRSNHQFEPLSKPFKVGLGFGIAVKDGNVRLRDQLNFGLKAFIESGAYKENYEKYISFR